MTVAAGSPGLDLRRAYSGLFGQVACGDAGQKPAYGKGSRLLPVDVGNTDVIHVAGTWSFLQIWFLGLTQNQHIRGPVDVAVEK
jgi:hypothetical protein